MLAINRRIQIYSRLVAMIDNYLDIAHIQSPTKEIIAIFDNANFDDYSLLLLGMRDRCRLKFFRTVLVQLLSWDTSILLNNHHRQLIMQNFSKKEQQIIFDATRARNTTIASLVLNNRIEHSINMLMNIFFSNSERACKILWENNFTKGIQQCPSLAPRELKVLTSTIATVFTNVFPSLVSEIA